MAKLIVTLLIIILMGGIFVSYKMDNRVDPVREIAEIKQDKQPTQVRSWGDTIDPVTLIEKQKPKEDGTKVKKKFTEKAPQEVELASPPPLSNKEPPQEVVEKPVVVAPMPPLPHKNPLKPEKRAEYISTPDDVLVMAVDQPLPQDLGPLQDPNQDPQEILQQDAPQDVPQETAPDETEEQPLDDSYEVPFDAPQEANTPPMPEGMNPGQAKNWEALNRHNQAQTNQNQAPPEEQQAPQQEESEPTIDSGPYVEPQEAPPPVDAEAPQRQPYYGGSYTPAGGINVVTPFFQFHIAPRPREWRQQRVERREWRRQQRWQRRQWRRYG